MTQAPTSAKEIQIKLLRIGLIYGGGAFLLNGILFFIMVAVTISELPLVSFMTVGAFVMVLVSDYIGIKLFFKPIYTHLQLAKQTTLSQEAYQDLYIRLLNYPIITVFRIFTFHVLPPYIVLFVMATYMISINLLGWSLVEYSIMASLLVVGVATHAVLEYFAVKRLIYPTLLYAYHHASDCCRTD